MTTPLAEFRLDRSTAIATAGLTLAGVYLALLAFAMGRWPYDRWMLLILAPVLVALGALIIWRVTRGDEVPLTRLIIVALVAKMGASVIRYFVTIDLYGSGDSQRYDVNGAAIANAFHRGELPLSQIIPSDVGTPFIDQFTGLLYTVMGPTRPGGFLVFSWIAFWGLFFFHRAALIGFPEADQRRYALLLFFLPSLLFWPSSIGKEALMLFGLGASAYGAARLLERRPWWWASLAIGLGTTYLVRPHVTAVVLGSIALSFLFRRSGKRPPIFGPAVRLLVVVGLIVITAFALGQAADRILPQYVETESSVDAVGALVERASTGTDEGGSQIDRPLPTNPLDYPYAAFTVLFRPTVLEANSIGTLVAAVETMVVLALFFVSWRRLANLPTVVLRRPYVLMCIVYTGIFAFAWSSFSNLGALARSECRCGVPASALASPSWWTDTRRHHHVVNERRRRPPDRSAATPRRLSSRFHRIPAGHRQPDGSRLRATSGPDFAAATGLPSPS